MVRAFAVLAQGKPLEAFEYALKGELLPHEIEVKITHCGICHSDLSLLDNEWGISKYPLIPGHEIVGNITKVGTQVSGLKVGDRVGIGWQRSSCFCCEWCASGEENLCLKQEATCVGHAGGFADTIRADGRFAFTIPDSLDSAHAAPLFCAGVTVFSPFVHHDITALSRVGIIGIGGLGHLALQFARGFGCEITAFSSNPKKKKEALDFGAHHFISSTSKEELSSVKNEFDFLLCTTPSPLDWQTYFDLLRPKGQLCFVGAQTKPIEVPFFSIISGRKGVTASNIGSRPDIRKMLEFAAKHKIKAEIEQFDLKEVNKAIEKMRSGNLRYRAVLRCS